MKPILGRAVLVLSVLVSSIAMAAPQPATNATRLTPAQRQALAQEKQISKWPLSGKLGKGGHPQAITVRECLMLGLKVDLWESCDSGLKCVNGSNAACITGM